MANKTGVYPVYENQFKIDKTGGTGATAENLVTIADMLSLIHISEPTRPY